MTQRKHIISVFFKHRVNYIRNWEETQYCKIDRKVIWSKLDTISYEFSELSETHLIVAKIFII